jgi:beta-glucanase (GH16 family)
MMNRLSLLFISIIIASTLPGFSQIDEAYEDFEGNSNIMTWYGDDCDMNTSFANPFPSSANPSTTVLRYHDLGGQYANVHFQMDDNFDLSINQTFTFKIYIPSNGITGNQNLQVSLKLQNGNLPEPWTTQSEIINNLSLDEWQTVSFDFKNDNYINLDPNSIMPTLRTDFNRGVIQVNGENNNDQVLAYIDDILLSESQYEDYIFDQLVWSDEFETGGAINPEKWFHQTQLPQGDSWYNNEIQHYTNRIDNSFVENGVLKIAAKRETFTDQGVTKDFTSARLNSKFAFQYGRVEIRAKLPFGTGTWPAMWTLGKNINEDGAYWDTQGFGTTGWPACGEIDIMEHWGSNQDYVSSAIHTPSSFGATVNLGGRIIPTVSTTFHDYTLIWTPEKMEFRVDGITHYIYNPPVKDESTWPFDAEQYLIFNVAILPSIAPGFTESALEIDYVRVYQESITSTTEQAINEAPIAYPNPFKDTITINTEIKSNREVAINIYAPNGRLVKTDKVNILDGKLTIDNLKELPNGSYLIHYLIDNEVYYLKAIKK